MKLFNIIIIIILILSTLLSCNKVSKQNLEELTQKGWEYYLKYDFDKAIEYFKKALSMDSSYPDALNGLGWSYLHKYNLSLSENYFSLAIKEKLNEDYLVGRAGVYLEEGKYFDAIEDAKKALEINPNFKSFHFKIDPITTKEVNILIALSYFFMKDYKRCQLIIDKLSPENNLDPDNKTTWKVNGKTFNSYQEALLNYIDGIF